MKRPLIPFPGSSFSQLPKLLECLPKKLPERLDIAELCVGGANFTFEMLEKFGNRINSVTINDIWRDLTHLFDVLTNSKLRKLFLSNLRWFPLSCEGLYHIIDAKRSDEKIWEELRREYPVDCALYFYFSMWSRHPGKISSTKRTFGSFTKAFECIESADRIWPKHQRPPREELEYKIDLLAKTKTAILTRDIRDILGDVIRCSRTLIFIDLPYSDIYAVPTNFLELARSVLTEIWLSGKTRAKCMLTLPYEDEVRTILDEITKESDDPMLIIPLNNTYPLGAHSGVLKKSTEVLITNYPVAQQVELQW